MFTHTERIRALNDQLRTTGVGGDVVVTQGLASHGITMLARVFAAVQAFTDFTPDNDPLAYFVDFRHAERKSLSPVADSASAGMTSPGAAALAP